MLYNPNQNLTQTGKIAIRAAELIEEYGPRSLNF